MTESKNFFFFFFFTLSEHARPRLQFILILSLFNCVCMQTENISFKNKIKSRLRVFGCQVYDLVTVVVVMVIMVAVVVVVVVVGIVVVVVVEEGGREEEEGQEEKR